MLFGEGLPITLDPPLGIPYFRGKPGSSSFVNLRENPDAINQIPELQDCTPLKDLVSAANGPSSIFRTLGCEKWTQSKLREEKFPQFAFDMGSYTDISFDDLRYATVENYKNLIVSFGTFPPRFAVPDTALVTFELRRTIYAGLERHVWTLEVWMYGLGQSEENARAAWATGIHCFREYMEWLSVEWPSVKGSATVQTI